MVTKKTRWLSAIAAVILLVSMFAGIVLPAGAESGSEILNALQKKYGAFKQEHFVVEIEGFSLEETCTKIADQIELYEETKLDHEKLIYEKIAMQIDQKFIEANKGNLVSDLIIRYSLREQYEALGYKEDASVYYISNVEDWNAAAASGSIFAKTTLLVTNDINFNGQKVEPLTVNETAFQGVLDGQGHRFINMIIEIGDTEPEKTYKYGGLVAALTGGTIKNLGLDGGEVNFDGQDVVTDRNEGVGSFAGYIGKDGLLQNCWSTMTITNKAKKNLKDQTILADGKNGVSGLIGWGEGGAIDNCFFAGEVNNIGDNRTATDLIGYTANSVKVYNSIGAGTLNCDNSRNPASVGVHYTMYSSLESFSVYNTYSVGKNAIRHRGNYNPYSYKTEDDAGNTIYKNYVTNPDTDITFTKDIVHKFTPEATNAAYMADTLEEAVWAVNNRFDATHQSANRDYIISIDKNGKLYMAKKEGTYRKITIEGSASGVYYFKEGTKVNLLKDMNLLVAESIVIDKKNFASALNGYDLTVPAGDIVLTVTYGGESVTNHYVTELTKVVQEYQKFNFDFFECAQLLKDWLKSAQTELAKTEKDLEKIKELIAMESGEDGFRSSMEFLPDACPPAKDYEIYQEFNASNKWTIGSVEDWQALTEWSKTYEGYTFYVVNDIDFKGQKMNPLTENIDPFKGVLDGQGHRFINMVIDIGDTELEKTYKYGGLVAALTGGTIKNLGLDGGEFIFAGEDVVTDRNEGVGSFAGYIGKGGLLQNCWSTMTVTNNTKKNSKGQTTLDGNKNGVAGLIGWGEGGAIDNCFFAGTVNNTGDKRAATDLIGYTANSVKVYNSIGAGTLNCDTNYNPAAVCVHYTMYSAVERFSVYNTYAVGKNAIRHRANYNPYNYKETNYVTNPDTDITFTKDVVHKFTPEATNEAYMINTLEEAVWAVNDRFDTTHQSADREYIISVDANGKLYMAKEVGAYRKITFMNKGEVLGMVYAIAGTTVKLAFENVLSFDSILVGNSSTLNKAAGTLLLGNEDVTIDVTLDELKLANEQIVILEELLKKYEGLNLDEYANGSEVTAWQIAAQKAIDDKDLAALILAVEQEKALAEGLALKEGFWPVFSQYEEYKDRNVSNEWAISSKEDWIAMDTYAKAAPEGNYFEGFTFHLTKNIDLENKQRLPLGAKDGRLFAGTIDGHGYGLENVNIKVVSSDVPKDGEYYSGGSMNGSVGLIAFLGDCEIRDFGVNSGTINAGTGNASGNVSTFGCVPENTEETAPTFTRVWSDAELVAAQGAHVNALVGLLSSTNAVVKVNGFIFTGTMKKAKLHDSENRNVAYVVFGGATATPCDKGEFYNILATSTINSKSNIKKSFLFSFSGPDAFKESARGEKVKNVYGFGVDHTYRSGTTLTVGETTVGGVNYEMVRNDISIVEAAWNINSNQVAGQESVYLTLKNGEVFFGTAENQIRRIKIMKGDDTLQTIYALPGESITLDAANAYIMPADAKSTLDGYKLTLGNEDLVVRVLICDHENAIYTPIPGTKTHNVHCVDCNKDLIDSCEIDIWTANDDLKIEDGVITAGTHTAACNLCGDVQTGNCQGTLVSNTNDCKLDGSFVFNCCDREAVTAIGSGKAGHTHSGNWTEVGAPDGKEIDKCQFCDVKLVRSIGKVNVSTGNMVYAGKEVDVVITLPYALNSAEIEIAPAVGSKYAITKVVAENLEMSNPVEQGGTYTATLANVQAGATITVTVKTEQYGFVADGLLNVKVFNAKNAEGDVTEATNQALIRLERMRGDADANGFLDVMDAMTALQYSVGQPVQIHTVNADMNGDGIINATDATLIVREWMWTV